MLLVYLNLALRKQKNSQWLHRLANELQKVTV